MITDFDRTITDEPGVVNEEVLREMKSLNKPLILVTGRTLSYTKTLYKKYPIWDCIIGENGCFVYVPSNGLTWNFTSDEFEKAKKLLKDKHFPARFGSSVISVSLNDKEKLFKVGNHFINDLTFKINVDEIMVLPKGIDKGRSLRMTLDYFGIDPKNTVIVGDGENDVDLFTVPGYKVAVANAHEKLKAHADEVTKKPSTQGVLEIIGKLKM